MSFGWAFLTSELSGNNGDIIKKTGDFSFSGVSSLNHDAEEGKFTFSENVIITQSNFKVVSGQATSQMYGVSTEADGNLSLNLNNGNNQIIFLGHNITMSNPSNAEDGGVYNFYLLQDTTGSRGVAYDSNFFFPGGVAPTNTTAAEAIDIVSCVYVADVGGGKFLCNTVQDFQST